MKERERAVVIALAVLLLLLWLGFAVHRSPRFAGSLPGGMLGVSGALLMLVPLAYTAVKRIPGVKKAATRHMTMPTLLAWHVYAGIVGAILALLHTGHKFQSTLGILLVASMFIAIFTGVVGRHFMGLISMEIREKQQTLGELEAAYRQTAGELARRPEQAALLPRFSGFFSRLATAFFVPAVEAEMGPGGLSYRAVRLAESMADLEYAIKSHEILKKKSARWLKLHIAGSVLFYILLTFHIWSGIHFGLRWFD